MIPYLDSHPYQSNIKSFNPPDIDGYSDSEMDRLIHLNELSRKLYICITDIDRLKYLIWRYNII